MNVHQLRKIELAPTDNPLAKISALGEWTININGTSPEGTPISLRISTDELPPQKPFTPKLKPLQYQALWLIAEGTVFPKLDGFAGWYLADKLEMEPSNLSRDIIRPLEKMKLVSHKSRPTTKPKSSHPNKHENVYYLKRENMRNIFNILFLHFQERYYRHMVWECESNKDPTWISCIAGWRFYALALLQKKIDEYENSPQYFIDMGVTVPRNLPSKKCPEELMQGEMRISVRGIGPLRLINETQGDRFP
jgi:hypothetical protein